ncbi:PucR family transcriptional regulator [Paenibacillus albicereus]|uniref:PucR family transcriptional regulator n=1 Tax=Paenibacillus albicereus TaxID=2726185 RepID=A0A6H2GUP1_9BACL|nr:PucR family transcriptional regulator [Paenibacillus albicereus]QJC50868.1 PucR family transcriptional regulator [Paenibacillus albicereus]
MNVTDLQVRDILQRPLFAGARLAAGSRGIGRPVGWVHVIEIVRNAPFVRPHDLILTTGLWLKQPVQDRLDYVRQLIVQEAAGLILELGTSIDEVAVEVLDLAEEHGFPVIVFDRPVRFSDITQDIHGLILGRRRASQDQADRFARRLQQLTLQHSDIAAVLRLLHADTGRQTVFYSLLEPDRHHPPLAAEPGQRELAGLELRELELAGRFGDGRAPLLLPLELGGQLLLRPVLGYGQLLAAVGLVVEDSEEAELRSPYLEAAASAAAALTLRTQFGREHEARRQDRLIPELMEGKARSEEQARSLAGLAAGGAGAALALLLELEADDGEDRGDRLEGAARDLPVLLRTLLRKHGLRGSLHAESASLTRLLLLADGGGFPAAEQRLLGGARRVLEDALRYAGEQLGGMRLRAAGGKARAALLDAPAAFREAGEALEIARRVPELGAAVFYHELGAYQLLQAIPDTQLLGGYVQDHLGPILQLEKEARRQLLETLDMYLKCFGSKHETARRLFIHRQTLYNRMERLTELIGDPFREPHKRIGLEMALMAYKLRSGAGPSAR